MSVLRVQLDIFESYFYRYNEWIVKQNQRISGSGYADIVKNLEEVIDIFSAINIPQQVLEVGEDPTNVFPLPEDYYLLNTVRYGGKEVERVSHNKIMNLLSSNLTSPTVSFPSYTMSGNDTTIYPSTIVDGILEHLKHLTGLIMTYYLDQFFLISLTWITKTLNYLQQMK